MAQYLIIAKDEANGTYVTQVEAKNMKDAARGLVTDDAPNKLTATIYRVAGPPKTITLRVKTSVEVEVT